ncbi:Telomere repeat-binding protein 1 [Rhynchospora pubera]|uniref:Telomere repeat-binding protein 1 n=1 Tax=Rhynchospora pubera TaxID=906938 RepID=A0AAV8GH77_9POAL|nr:Telomere repeat-binding protein 1 [Rhynchospora pubera]
MVLKRRLSYGSRGYYLPPIPDIPKPTKKKRTARKKVMQNPLAAFDMLATVAGNLLNDLDTDVVPVKLEGAPNYNSSLKKEPLEEPLDQLKTPKMESPDQNSTNQSTAEPSDLSPKTLTDKQPDLCTNGYEVQFAAKQGQTDIDLVRSISSESSSEFSLYSGGVGIALDPNPSSLETRLTVNRDDDENTSWCTDAVVNKSSKRMKKSCVDKLKKVISRSKKYDAAAKVINDRKRKCYAQQMSQKNRFKRRTLFHCSSNSSPNSQVRLRIKSFKVPEISIEIAESASIGTLKRTVMEALAAVLEGELTVGVMLEGKKVRENSRRLREAGIFCDSPLLDTVGFALEPEPVQSPLKAPHTSSDSFDNRDVVEPLASDMPATPSSLEPVPVPVPTTPVKSHVTDPDPVLSPIEVSSAEQAVPQISQAIIPLPVPAVKIEPLAVVPAVRKTRQVDTLGQRRMRRPFSVAEVEALVAAVEKLGTGRWRDVKIRAFETAKHRTYVDLKDKWKTLVHTATIAPQQRRGEPVPQELLDRVLAAQSYWSHQHSKLAKSSIGEPGLVDYDSSPSPVKITSL